LSGSRLERPRQPGRKPKDSNFCRFSSCSWRKSVNSVIRQPARAMPARTSGRSNSSSWFTAARHCSTAFSISGNWPAADSVYLPVATFFLIVRTLRRPVEAHEHDPAQGQIAPKTLSALGPEPSEKWALKEPPLSSPSPPVSPGGEGVQGHAHVRVADGSCCTKRPGGD